MCLELEYIHEPDEQPCPQGPYVLIWSQIMIKVRDGSQIVGCSKRKAKPGGKEMLGVGNEIVEGQGTRGSGKALLRRL